MRIVCCRGEYHGFVIGAFCSCVCPGCHITFFFWPMVAFPHMPLAPLPSRPFSSVANTQSGGGSGSPVPAPRYELLLRQVLSPSKPGRDWLHSPPLNEAAGFSPQLRYSWPPVSAYFLSILSPLSLAQLFPVIQAGSRLDPSPLFLSFQRSRNLAPPRRSPRRRLLSHPLCLPFLEYLAKELLCSTSIARVARPPQAPPTLLVLLRCAE